jgi:hypothetical protein
MERGIYCDDESAAAATFAMREPGFSMHCGSASVYAKAGTLDRLKCDGAV